MLSLTSPQSSYKVKFLWQASTWFCKPQQADAVASARNGWINSGVDTLSCEVQCAT